MPATIAATRDIIGHFNKKAVYCDVVFIVALIDVLVISFCPHVVKKKRPSVVDDSMTSIFC